MGKKKKAVSRKPIKAAVKPKAKEPVPKGKVEVTIRRKAFGEAPEEYHFVLADGRRLKSLYELTRALTNMGEDVFRHHVSEAKNDFSTWINDVFKMPDLAKEMKKVKDKMHAEMCLLRKLVDELKKEDK